MELTQLSNGWCIDINSKSEIIELNNRLVEACDNCLSAPPYDRTLDDIMYEPTFRQQVEAFIKQRKEGYNSIDSWEGEFNTADELYNAYKDDIQSFHEYIIEEVIDYMENSYCDDEEDED